jgi:hypothetical protein
VYLVLGAFVGTMFVVEAQEVISFSDDIMYVFAGRQRLALLIEVSPRSTISSLHTSPCQTHHGHRAFMVVDYLPNPIPTHWCNTSPKFCNIRMIFMFVFDGVILCAITTNKQSFPCRIW